MKILSNKNYEKLCNEILDLKNELNLTKESKNFIEDTNRELGDKIEFQAKEIKRLKTLLTKNNINYKKENNKNGK